MRPICPRLLPAALCLCLCTPGASAADGIAIGPVSDQPASDDQPAPENAPLRAGDVRSAAIDAPAPDQLDTIVVVATRSARALAEVPGTVDRIDRETMDRQQVRDLQDLFRYTPGVSVGRNAGRFGLGDLRIRGLGGNRVLLRTDGVPVGDGFAIGSFADANRDFVDLDTLKAVEVLRGPGSALYGSDALGGVVAFVTRDPEDYLDADKRSHLGLRLGYDGGWDGLSAHATWAAGGERWSGLVAAGRRQGQAHENQGRNDRDGALRTARNPEERDGGSLLAKLVYAPDARQRLRLTLDTAQDRSRSDARSGRGFQALTGATVADLRGDDRRHRARLSLQHEIDRLEWAIADALVWQLHRQDSRTEQRTDERRITAGGAAQRRERGFVFEQRSDGADAHLERVVDAAHGRHTLSWGVELRRTDTRQRRDGRATLLSTGAQTPVIPPDVFPVRDFPNSTTTTAAVYLQDEIALAEGALRLLPALRVDHYRLRARPDAIFRADNPEVAVEGLALTQSSPKFGAVWRFAPRWSLWGSYARGFRAPPYNDVNIGFTNLAFGYTAWPNPDLEAETSDGVELGLRHGGQALSLAVTAYRNRYRDFIESLRFIGTRADGISVFQSQNVARAEIEGLELEGDLDGGALHPRLRGWRLRAAAAVSRGEDRDSGAVLESVDPARATLGVGYEQIDGDWGVELSGRFAQRRHRLEDPTRYRPPGYAVFDLAMHWRFAPGARLHAGIENIFDRRYTDWADVPGVAADSAVLDRYTRAGRTLALDLALSW